MSTFNNSLKMQNTGFGLTSINYPDDWVEPTIYGVKYPSNLVQNVKVNDKYVAAVSTNDKVFNRHSATLSDAKPFVNNLTVNHASLPACRFAHSGTLNSNIDNS